MKQIAVRKEMKKQAGKASSYEKERLLSPRKPSVHAGFKVLAINHFCNESHYFSPASPETRNCLSHNEWVVITICTPDLSLLKLECGFC